MAKITVGIPVYNGEPLVRGAIESILAQTFRDFDILVLDDCSTDGTPDVVKSFRERVRYLRNETNLGIGATRQRIAEEADSEYLCFLSADDRFHPTFMSEMLAEAERHPNEIIYCGLRLCNEQSVPIAVSIPNEFETHEDFCVHSLEMGCKNSISVNFSSILAPAEAFRRVPFDEGLRYGEDLDSVLRLMKHFRFRPIKKALVDIMLHSMSETSQKFWSIPENNRKIIDGFWRYWRG